jgi:hypothetical protein
MSAALTTLGIRHHRIITVLPTRPIKYGAVGIVVRVPGRRSTRDRHAISIHILAKINMDGDTFFALPAIITIPVT